jgi:hypothetical protein
MAWIFQEVAHRCSEKGALEGAPHIALKEGFVVQRILSHGCPEYTLPTGANDDIYRHQDID